MIKYCNGFYTRQLFTMVSCVSGTEGGDSWDCVVFEILFVASWICPTLHHPMTSLSRNKPLPLKSPFKLRTCLEQNIATILCFLAKLKPHFATLPQNILAENCSEVHEHHHCIVKQHHPTQWLWSSNKAPGFWRQSNNFVIILKINQTPTENHDFLLIEITFT